MAGGESHHEPSPPPPGESIHLPGPSYLPVIVAAGLTITLVGVVLSWWVVAIGMLTTVIPTIRWIGQVRADISELPLEHH